MNYIKYNKKTMNVCVTSPLNGDVHTYEITEQYDDGYKYWTFGNNPSDGLNEFINTCIPIDRNNPDDTAMGHKIIMTGLVTRSGVTLGGVGFDTLTDLISFLKSVDKAFTKRYGHSNASETNQ